MPSLHNRHWNAQYLIFKDFSGGLNLSAAPESVAENESRELINIDYNDSSGKLKLRPGIIEEIRMEYGVDYPVAAGVPGNTYQNEAMGSTGLNLPVADNASKYIRYSSSSISGGKPTYVNARAYECQTNADITAIIPLSNIGQVNIMFQYGDRIYARINGVIYFITAYSGVIDWVYWGERNQAGENDIIIASPNTTAMKRIYINQSNSVNVWPIQTNFQSPTWPNGIGPNTPQNVRKLFIWKGRLAVACRTIPGGPATGGNSVPGEDLVFFSGVGDPEDWDLGRGTGGDTSGSQWYQVGYKDAGIVVNMNTLGGDLIVFKSPEGYPERGRIYRMIWDSFTDGVSDDYIAGISQIADLYNGVSTWGQFSVVPVANDLLFVSKEGVISLATASEYGDYKQLSPGLKINDKLCEFLGGNCRTWHIKKHSQIWINDGNTDTVWVFHPAVGDSGFWTKFRFCIGMIKEAGQEDAEVTINSQGVVVKDAISHGDNVYLAFDNYICKMVETEYTDTVGGPAASRDKYPIRGLWMPKMTIAINQLLLKKIMISYSASDNISAELFINTDEKYPYNTRTNRMGETIIDPERWYGYRIDLRSPNANTLLKYGGVPGSNFVKGNDDATDETWGHVMGWPPRTEGEAAYPEEEHTGNYLPGSLDGTDIDIKGRWPKGTGAVQTLYNDVRGEIAGQPNTGSPPAGMAALNRNVPDATVDVSERAEIYNRPQADTATPPDYLHYTTDFGQHNDPLYSSEETQANVAASGIPEGYTGLTIYEATTPMKTGIANIKRVRCNVRGWEVQPLIVVKDGTFDVTSVQLEIAEV